MKFPAILLVSMICAIASAMQAADTAIATNAQKKGTGNCQHCKDEKEAEAKAAATNAVEEKGAPAEFKSVNPLYHEADVALNEARMHTGGAESAVERAQRLEALAAKFPEYEYRADMLYYAGVNYQMLKQYDQAISAFEAALRSEPDIAKETPILSYLKTLKGRTFIKQANVTLLTLLLVSLVWALWRLLRTDVVLPWGRLVATYGVTVALWAVLVWLLPLLLGHPQTGLDAYPKPVLSNISLGQMGDASLWALLWYGAGAILATLPVMAAAATIPRKPVRVCVSVLGVTAVVFAIMGLFGVRYCWADTQYDSSSKRVFFMIKNIATKEEVPDEMLPLYDKSFQQRILASRQKAASATNAATSGEHGE